MAGRTAGWWYWLATTVLLWTALAANAAGPAGTAAAFHTGFLAAVALCVIQVVHFRMTEGHWRAFPVQVRLAFLALLLMAAWPPLRVLLLIQACGTLAFVTTGYCLLARCLSLMPWNRRAPLSWELLAATLFRFPAAPEVPVACACGHATGSYR